MLVEIKSPDFDVDIDIAYATNNNFTGAPVYKRPACYLHPAAAAAQARACELAAQLGYRFCVFDAYRPAEAQWALWRHTPDPDFIAIPWRGSPHSRGVAIDLTLVDGEGQHLEMGTGFDEFTLLSHHGNTEISVQAQKNRHLLMGIMTTAGWDFFRNEWWHYQLFDARQYPVLKDADAGTEMM
ncbi:MAG: D-alanyl-D-alanine dipeptidase [Alphaproteobacteria bacterium]|jgi:D-alanyl-D-alanine dipeptidase|nr:D-alanyl-D-alanine dipeptidase [Alphaproteobacteria bacterium]MBT4017701.1 D-alanyl-D-alanine dipeptidase [Alphaproteobacteria bacterium]MBT5160903.1 D-alanyl-D-alanine dipeptidase [Alphaproteobacteria bacterium]MBT5919313.1 D-alanyl-D-alanine dipeptidase [Alphaproteobacteria bacterium]MBT6387923.1 D-alanyl-D-alanine dipeptidase [Alphaproteobacteria bacterium]